MITTQAMRTLETQAEQRGITTQYLMEQAGRGVVKAIDSKYGIAGKKFLIVCYHGSNGGDGFVAARLLVGMQEEVTVLFLGDEAKLKSAAVENFRALKFLDKEHNFVHYAPEGIDYDSYDIIIDAILGSGAHGTLDGMLLDAVQAINNSPALVVSIDVPTGIDPDTGNRTNANIDADLIVCLHDIKKGLVVLQDKVMIADIGLPHEKNNC